MYVSIYLSTYLAMCCKHIALPASARMLLAVFEVLLIGFQQGFDQFAGGFDN